MPSLTTRTTSKQPNFHLSPLTSHFSFLISHFQLQIILLLGFALRLHYLTTSHPFFDEYISVLAARQITEYGWPRLPSGLFYEHGLLSTYLMTPFTALFIHSPREEWHTAQWGLMLARWPSLWVSTLTIAVIYAMGQRMWRQTQPAMFAAALFALSPEGMVWGGRARMYALATLLALLTVYYAYRSLRQPTYRWWALLALALTLLTQFGALVLIPPLIVAWTVGQMINYKLQITNYKFSISHFSLLTSHLSFLTLLAFIIIGSIFIKRLGQPLGKPALDSPDSGNLSSELITTVTYQADLSLNWADMEKFLARQFGVPHLYWLTLITLFGLCFIIVVQIYYYWRGHPSPLHLDPFTLFISITFAVIILQALTLLDSSRRNPRYFVMYLPLFYLIAAKITWSVSQLVSRAASQSGSRAANSPPPHSPLPTPHSLLLTPYSLLLIPYSLLLTFTLPDIQLALATPEPAYEQALEYVHSQWQPGDILLTMNTPAASLYLNHADGFTVEFEADQFLLNRDTAPIDRWLGASWVATAAEFNTLLNHHARVWYVSDTIRQPVYFGGSWQALLTSQMNQVWANDNALVYLTRPDRTPLPSQPDTTLNAQFGQLIQLNGYTQKTNQDQLHLTLFWQALAPMSIDYTVFVHLRNADGQTVAQQDRQPLDGQYPTHQWHTNETIIDPMTLTLPANLPTNRYTLYIGLYRLDTLERLPLANDLSGENAAMEQLEMKNEK